MRKVLFVCTGNICRSPSAEGVLRAKAEMRGIEIFVDSAGTHGYHVGEPPDPRSIKAAAARGYDISNLRARKLHREDFEKFDLLIALDEGHFKEMQRSCPPELRHKLRRMMNFAPQLGMREVPDPYYGSARDFELVLNLLDTATDGLLDQVTW